MKNFYSLQEINKKEKISKFVKCRIEETKINFKMLSVQNDCGVATRFHFNNHYESKTISIFSKLCKQVNNKIIIDIGAHTGVYSLAAMKSNKNNIVLSFEPYFMNFARLSTNFKLNALNTDNLIYAGVGDQNSTETLKITGNPHYHSSGGSILNEKGIPFQINLIKLDTFISDNDKQRVAIIKIDVEGYEDRVLKGMMHVIDLAKPIIIFECWSLNVRDFFEKTLSNLGYYFFEIDDKSYSIEKNIRLTSSEDYYKHNRIAVHKSCNLDIT